MARVPRFMLLALLLGIAGMVAALLYSVPEEPHEHPASQSAPPDGGMGMEANLSDTQVESLGDMMRKLQENPNDGAALLAIGETFVEAQDWVRAESFLHRAVMSRPGDIRPRYLLAFALYNQNKMAEAAATFEELLQIREDPAALYNLAVIYKYSSTTPEKARPLLEKILASPDANEQTKERAEKLLSQ